MPIYDYQCRSCGHTFDVLQRISEGLLTDCPECGEPELKKLVSTPKVHFKGDGWNATAWKKQPPQARSLAHRFDSATPHDDHHDHGHSHGHGHSHDHGKGHSHDHGGSEKSGSNTEHKHEHKPGHKHDHKHDH